MESFPHHYQVKGSASPNGSVNLSSGGVSDIVSAPPVQFGGPGDKWSPESLLVAAVADCFILTFKAIAKASKFEWESLACEVEGVLEKSENLISFTKYNIRASLVIKQGIRHELASRLLEKAEKSCLITNSLSGETELSIELIEGAG